MRVLYRPQTRCNAATRRLLELFARLHQEDLFPGYRMVRSFWSCETVVQRIVTGPRGRRRWRTIARFVTDTGSGDEESLDDAHLDITVNQPADAHEVTLVVQALKERGMPYESKIVV